ncbi:MAG: HAD family hydrolase, partial [Phycisphaeraceae bacterium]|nr:HAD family hydrolase [Phycisphaeraceae bacterium]
MKPAVFLDRDNTLIHNDGDLGDPDEVRLIQGAASAIASLRGLGYRIVVITNQGGVARGKYGEEDVEAVHARINEMVEKSTGATIDRFYYCPYHPEGSVKKYAREHPWRKPQPGMLKQAAEDLGIDLTQSWMIGDALRDIEAGRAVGARTILLTQDAQEIPAFDERPAVVEEEGEAGEGAEQPVRPHHVARRLIEAVRIVAQQRRPDVAEEMQARAEANMRMRHAARLTAEASAGKRRSDTLEKPGRKTPESSKPDAQTEMDAQPVEPEPPKPPTPKASKPATGTSPVPPITPAEPTASEEPVEPEPVEKAVAPPEPPAPERELPSAEKSAPASTGPDSPPEPDPPKPSTRISGSATQEQLLRQLLQEVRDQGGRLNEHTYIDVVAIVLQMVAILCLLGGLVMGQSDTPMFLRWLAAGILVQLA